jgi:Family of unknown function (DUF6455)
MWIALFTIAIVAAIGFGVAAINLQPGTRSASLSRQHRWSAAAFQPKWLSGGDMTDTAHSVDWSDAQSREFTAHSSENATLLLRRMKTLFLDPDDLARSDPLLFRQLETRCRQCESQARCASDLAHNSTDQMSRHWRYYCPNGAMLNMLSTLRGCYFDMQKIAAPL